MHTSAQIVTTEQIKKKEKQRVKIKPQNLVIRLLIYNCYL